MGTNVHLTPALEQFAREAVESGRYNNVSEVVRSALRMLQDSEQQREVFEAMLREVSEENARLGTVSAQDAIAAARAAIAEVRARKAAT